MNNNINISNRDKKYIENYCKVAIENNDKIRIKSLACLLDKQYALYEILEYIKNDLGIDNNNIWRGDILKYVRKLKRGHIQFTNMDLYYPNCYLHQYVICKYLGIDMKEVQKYVIHHIDEDKQNNNISNLWIFYDTACHVAYHRAVKHGDIDIKEFTENYINNIVSSENKEEIQKYLEVLKLYKKNAYLFAVDEA